MTTVRDKFRLYRRSNGIFYWQENESCEQGSLRTKDRKVAEKLLHAKNESHRQPTINLSMARTYLAAHDPKVATRTWQVVMDEMARHGKDSTKLRASRTFSARAFNGIRHKPIVQTIPDDFLAIIHGSGNATVHYLRRLHNLALDLGWLPWPVLAKRGWPKISTKRTRAVTAAEHALIIASEKNPEKRAYYEFLWETGAAQSDAAEIEAAAIDWNDCVLSYRRKKLSDDSEPARLSIGPKLRELLQSRPRFGPLFPTIKTAGSNVRATEFRRRCRLAEVSGVSLHSYRYSWAQRAKSCGYPQRFAQNALGHSSRAVHEAYARGADIIVPPLDEYEDAAKSKILIMPPHAAPMKRAAS